MFEKKDNLGFSLVELIATVLIMGVVMVALTPQVIKWVDQARDGADVQNREGLVSITQVVVAEYESAGNHICDDTFIINSSGVVVAGGGAIEANSGMRQMFEDHLCGAYPKILGEEGKVFQIHLSENGAKISVTMVDGTY